MNKESQRMLERIFRNRHNFEGLEILTEIVEKLVNRYFTSEKSNESDSRTSELHKPKSRDENCTRVEVLAPNGKCRVNETFNTDSVVRVNGVRVWPHCGRPESTESIDHPPNMLTLHELDSRDKIHKFKWVFPEDSRLHINGYWVWPPQQREVSSKHCWEDSGLASLKYAWRGTSSHSRCTRCDKRLLRDDFLNIEDYQKERDSRCLGVPEIAKPDHCDCEAHRLVMDLEIAVLVGGGSGLADTLGRIKDYYNRHKEKL